MTYAPSNDPCMRRLQINIGASYGSAVVNQISDVQAMQVWEAKSVQCSVAVPQHPPLAVQRGVSEMLRLVPLDRRVRREQQLADGVMEPLNQFCSAKCALW